MKQDEFMKFIEFLNSNSGALTLLVTIVYVAATIIICWANYQSAKASREQLDEMKKQYEDENRPRIETEYIFVKRSIYGLRFVNHGKETAQNVTIELSEDFINSLGKTSFSVLLKKQKGKKCVIGIQQHHDIFFAGPDYLHLKGKVPITGTIRYNSHRGVTYEEKFNIDAEHYTTFYSASSNEEKVLEQLKKQSLELESISKAILDIAHILDKSDTQANESD